MENGLLILKAENFIPLRFGGFSDKINIKKLERETVKILFLGFLVSALFHSTLFVAFKGTKQEAVKIDKKNVKVDIVFKRPRLTRPYIVPRPYYFQKRDTLKRIIERRIYTSAVPGGKAGFKSTFTREELLKIINDYNPNMTDAEISMIISEIDSAIHDEIKMKYGGLGKFEPKGYEFSDKLIRKDPGLFSLKDEMLNIDDLDNGEYKGLVIKDPKNPANLKGFVYVPVGVWGSILKPAVSTKTTVRNLSNGLKKYTGVNLKIDKPVYLENPGLSKYPFLYISADQLFDLTELEKENFGNYLKKGGFVLLDAYNPPDEPDKYPPKGLYSLRQMIKDSLGGYVTFYPITEREDPIFHTFYHIEFPEQLFKQVTPEELEDMGPYIEAAWIGERLVAVISDRGIGASLETGGGLNFETPNFRIIMNMIAYSLIKENSLAVKYIDTDYGSDKAR